MCHSPTGSRFVRISVAPLPDAPTAQDILDRENVTAEYITDPQTAADVVAQLVQADSPLGLDLETAKVPDFANHKQAGLDPHLSQIRLVQFYDGRDTAFVFDIFALGLEPLARLWDRPMVVHNAVFELKHLLSADANLQQVDCTMLAANALSGHLPRLADLALEHLGWDMPKDLQVSDWNAEDLSSEQLAYAALDAVAAYKLYHTLEVQLKEKDRIPVYRLMRDAQYAIARVELNGIHFDVESHQKLIRT